MRLTALSATAAALLSPSAASAISAPRDLQIKPRAAPDAPSGGYAPSNVTCPSNSPTIRGASALSSEESDWRKTREETTRAELKTFLDKIGIADFDAGSYLERDNAWPRIAISLSGGGYRALLNGAGFIKAADSRTGGDKGIGGLLQSTTYLSGLSGGSWLVGSIYANNFSTITQLQENDAVWQFQDTIFSGPSSSSKSIGALDTAKYWKNIYDEVESKDDAGFETSLTDYWGRAVTYQLIGDDDGGAAYTVSSIADADHFKNGNAPFPIIVADGRNPNELIISLNSTVFEFNPFEMGSWDPTLFGFVPLEYLGSNFDKGSISKDGKCVRGFDQFSFILGTSSSLFNMAMLTEFPDEVPSLIVDKVESLLSSIDDANNDIAQYRPNPFLGYNSEISNIADEEELSLVDGGMDLQNIPLHPVIQPAREVDVIFAVDSSADTNNWPNGTALRATYDRAGTDIANGTEFPSIPDQNTFINLKLNAGPTFFGCDASNFTNSEKPPPLIVYVPNAPYTFMSNVSTFDPSYEIEERDSIIQNGFNGATQGEGSLDDKWSTCVACAVLSRSFHRTGTEPPQACKDCFDKYCWDGSINDAEVQSYLPDFRLEEDNAGSSLRLGGAWWTLVVAGATWSVFAI
ncbi:related to lysophospholipase (lpl) [Cephalotrichum gorgonifer]|uniref:Lysophospholipase n=1 Tax=Cephalotrichum gorgonifer TaxID=2041049 RepID=A0AAE8MZK6_9PEZI|nr:related to lysophospholipase (lpl) [Cephalotrichum gorgonifer]